tara:strand:+ start:119 stop:319 length:201 start_codon:yes stop_codon:yes gene_type:complete
MRKIPLNIRSVLSYGNTYVGEDGEHGHGHGLTVLVTSFDEVSTILNTNDVRKTGESGQEKGIETRI